MLSIPSRLPRRLILAGMALLGLAAAPAAQAQEKARILLDWGWLPYHAAFMLAQDRGYFREAGVEVEIEQGRGSNSTAIIVGQGGFDMGHINVTNAANAIARGVPLKVVNVYMHRSPASFFGIKGKVRLENAQSLLGLRIGSTPGGSDQLSLSIFRRMNNFGERQLNVVSLDASAKTAALLTGRIDVVSGDSYSATPLLRSTGQEAEIMELADFKVPLLGFGFVANESFMRQHPKAVTAVLAGIQRGFAAMQADIEGSCTMIRGRVQISGTQTRCIDYIGSYMHLATAPTDPSWGRSEPQEWEAMIEALRTVGEITSDKPATAYYSNDLLPAR